MNISSKYKYYQHMAKNRAKIISFLIMDKSVLDYGSGDTNNDFVKHIQNLCNYNSYDVWQLEPKKADIVICNNVLEEVVNPKDFLNSIKKYIGKTLIITVPNSHTINRIMGIANNFIKSEYDLDYQDLEQGHRRYYDKDLIINELISAGFKILHIWYNGMKLFPHSEMEKIDEKFYHQIDNLIKYDSELEPYCAEIILECEINE